MYIFDKYINIFLFFIVLIFVSCSPYGDVRVKGIEVFVQNPNVQKNIGTFVWAEINPSFATNQRIMWTSSNNVVSLEGRNIIVENFGRSMITGTTEDGNFSDSVEVWTSPTGFWYDGGTNYLMLYENGSYTLDLFGSDSSGFWRSFEGQLTLTEFPGSNEILIDENFYDQFIDFNPTEVFAISGFSLSSSFYWVTSAF